MVILTPYFFFFIRVFLFLSSYLQFIIYLNNDISYQFLYIVSLKNLDVFDKSGFDKLSYFCRVICFMIFNKYFCIFCMHVQIDSELYEYN